jgi:SAM-dependent methyltransferase
MATQSARQAGGRPFYAAYGWAYDLLITHSVQPWADMVSAALDRAGIAAPARILDAGCGTGQHAAELSRRGHRLDLMDASASLLGQARARLPHAPAHRADLCTLDLGTRYDAITCRGVLNDLLHDQDREAAITALARHLHGDGMLFLDVRDMDRTRQRYARGRSTRRTVSLDDGHLVFSAAGTCTGGLLHVRERHEHHHRDGSVDAASYEMTMRPWDPGELHARLGRAGLTVTSLRYDASRPASDHLLCIAAPAAARQDGLIDPGCNEPE